jgi:phosphatidate cytidylyltransferase
MGNLATRIIVSLFGIPLIIIVSILGKFPFLLFTLFIGLISFFEFSKMLARRKYFPNLMVGFISISFIIFNSYYNFISISILVLSIVVVLFLLELFRRSESAIANLGTSLIGIFYIGFFSSALVLIREYYNDSRFLYDQGGYLIIAVLATIWICDSTAYFVGSAIGKHKILPRISPHKSWEGAAAGFLFSIISMVIAQIVLLGFMTMQNAVAIGVIAGLFGQVGDFVESLLKRDANVKDSSSLIPGHGGILDRFDSLLFSAPIIYIYLEIFIQR